ncbi:MAG: Gfo/Idh/MocA family oxidoreductase [Candidatus Pacearchaeota archaeon]|jgi:predicted dehydrogenase/sugar phosphate isomerase/epimerase
MTNLGIMQGRVNPDSVEKLQVFPLGWEKEIDFIKELGFDCIELLDDKKGVFRNILKIQKAKLFDKLKSSNLEFNSVCADRLCDFSLLNKGEIFLKELDEIIGLLPDKKNFVIVVPFFDENKIKNSYELGICLSKLARYDILLGEKNIQFALEIDLKAEEIKKMMNLFNFKNIKICYDLGNNLGKGANLYDEITLLGSLINHVHIKDKVDNKNSRIRKNNPEMQKGFNALVEIGFNKKMIFETCIFPSPYDEAKTNLETINEYLGNKQTNTVNKNLKALFIGLGSVGQRHLQNLKSLNLDIEIFALRSSKNNNVIKNGVSSETKSLEDYYGITSVYELEEAKKIKPNIVFITNPSSLHLKYALEFARLGTNLFIEKPITNSLEGIEELKTFIKDNKIISMVGYQTRFNPLYQRIKKIIQIEKDKIISASFEWNTFLPSHHKYEDYSKGYAARKDLGGGVVLCLIHEIDMIYDLLGMPEKIFAIGGKISNLNMDAEDTIFSLLKYKFNNKEIPIGLNLSFAQTKEIRKFKIQFTDKTLLVDLGTNQYELYGADGELIERYEDKTTRNEFFINEILHFLECVKKKEETIVNINEAVKSLEIALKIKESLNKGIWI